MIAAAVAGEAAIVVTNDRRLRSEVESAALDLVALSADDFAARLWDLTPHGVEAVIQELAAKRTRRPVTSDELAEALRRPFPTMISARAAHRPTEA